VRAQRVLGEINDELLRRSNRPLEEDFISTDAFGQNPGHARILNIDGVEIRVRMLHRRGLRQTDIKGADLLYEIAGRKFALIQYKITTGPSRVRKDADQLANLVSACPNPCPPAAHGLWPTCGAWFNVISGSQTFYMPACVAQGQFRDNHSCRVERFRSGVSADVFQELFARCWIGARIAPSEFAYLSWSTLQEDRVLFSVLQLGSFGR